MNDRLKFQFDTYQHSFKQLLRTSHGIWRVREGIIVSLSNGLKTTRGEIAPLSWFGSETLAQALKFCQQLPEDISLEEIAAIPDNLPCCQFAFQSALHNLNCSQSDLNLDDLDYCYLLPAGKTALDSWQAIYNQHHNSTFKWKIGVESFVEELKILQQLVKILPNTVKLRLDANGGLDLVQAHKLLEITDSLPTIEFIEQPLSPDNFALMLQLSQAYKTPLALDESVASFEQLQFAHQQGWQEIFVIKASIMCFPHRLIEYCQQHSLDVVFSSVFETDVGRNSVFRLAQSLNNSRALGFGLDCFF